MQQVTVGGDNSSYSMPSNATEYCPIVGVLDWPAVELDACQVISTPGTIDRLYIEVNGAPGVGESWIFTIRVNGAAPGGTPTVTITGAAVAGSDLANSVVVAAGDYVDIQCVGSAAAPANREARWSIRFTGTQARESLILGCSMDTLNPAATEYCAVQSSQCGILAINQYNQVVPTPGTIKNLYVQLSISPGVNPDGYRFTLFINGIATALTCTVTAPALTASDLVNNVVVAAGDRAQLRVEPLNVPINAPTPHWGLAFVADIDGESVIMSACTNSVDVAAVEYMYLCAIRSNWFAGEAGYNQLAQECVFRKMHVWLAAAPGGVASHTLNLRVNGGAGNLTVTITGAATTGSDLVNSDNIPNSAEVDMENTPGGVPAVGAAFWGLVGYIAPTGGPPPSGSIAEKLVSGGLL